MAKIDIRFIPIAFSLEELKDEEGNMMVDIPTTANFEDPADMAPTNTFSESLKEIEANDLLVFILKQLDDREKIIFLYQIVKENGYEINHDDFAGTMHLEVRNYYTHLKRLREKVALIYEHYFAKQ